MSINTLYQYLKNNPQSGQKVFNEYILLPVHDLHIDQAHIRVDRLYSTKDSHLPFAHYTQVMNDGFIAHVAFHKNGAPSPYPETKKRHDVSLIEDSASKAFSTLNLIISKYQKELSSLLSQYSDLEQQLQLTNKKEERQTLYLQCIDTLSKYEALLLREDPRHSLLKEMAPYFMVKTETSELVESDSSEPQASQDSNNEPITHIAQPPEIPSLLKDANQLIKKLRKKCTPMQRYHASVHLQVIHDTHKIDPALTLTALKATKKLLRSAPTIEKAVIESIVDYPQDAVRLAQSSGPLPLIGNLFSNFSLLSSHPDAVIAFLQQLECSYPFFNLLLSSLYLQLSDNDRVPLIVYVFQNVEEPARSRIIDYLLQSPFPDIVFHKDEILLTRTLMLALSHTDEDFEIIAKIIHHPCRYKPSMQTICIYNSNTFQLNPSSSESYNNSPDSFFTALPMLYSPGALSIMNSVGQASTLAECILTLGSMTYCCEAINTRYVQKFRLSHSQSGLTTTSDKDSILKFGIDTLNGQFKPVMDAEPHNVLVIYSEQKKPSPIKLLQPLIDRINRQFTCEDPSEALDAAYKELSTRANQLRKSNITSQLQDRSALLLTIIGLNFTNNTDCKKIKYWLNLAIESIKRIIFFSSPKILHSVLPFYLQILRGSPYTATLPNSEKTKKFIITQSLKKCLNHANDSEQLDAVSGIMYSLNLSIDKHELVSTIIKMHEDDYADHSKVRALCNIISQFKK